MNILGISYTFDNCVDSNAALLTDLGYAILEEERLTYKKHAENTFPFLSICKLLKHFKLQLIDIDIIVIPIISEKKLFLHKLSELFSISIELINKINFIDCDHHTAHFFNAYNLSLFNDCAGLVIDEVGSNYTSISFFKMFNKTLKCIKTYPLPVSIGRLYSIASEYCTNSKFSEGKLMGLSSYGIDTKKRFLTYNNKKKQFDLSNELKKLYKWLKITNIKKYKFTEKLIKILNDTHIKIIKNYLLSFYPYKKLEYLNEIIYYKDIAATILENYNDIFISLLKELFEITNLDSLIISGGCILNCIANSYLSTISSFKYVYSSSIPHDGGISLGFIFYAAYLFNIQLNVKKDILYSPLIYNINQIDLQLKTKIKITQINIDTIIIDLNNNAIIGWFLDGSEVGPRALGHRSILASTANRNNLITINNDIKHRELYRPLAPIVLDIEFNNIFNNYNVDLTLYMLQTLKINKAYIKKLIAVCHVDNTTRPLYLNRKTNPILYDLLYTYYLKTKIPCLVNTSFNDNNLPIVETLDDAIKFLIKTPKLNYIIYNGKYKISRINE